MMKSRTSFFNPTVLLKDITRFCPVWVLYLIFGLLSLFTVREYPMEESYVRTMFLSIVPLTSINLFYALLVAQMLFGDLFNKRLCSGLHALSPRREGWFLTHTVAGLLFSIVPNLILCLIHLPRLGIYWHTAFYWLLLVTLEYLFFFGSAVFGIMCSGNRIGSISFYVLLNFGALIVRWFWQTIYLPLLYGIQATADRFLQFCPVLNITYYRLSVFTYGYDLFDYRNIRSETNYFVIIAVIGIVLLGGAVLLYRKRKLECAGELMAFRWMRPIFAVLFTLSVGALFEMVGSSISEQPYIFLSGGIVIGFFVIQMLLQRTVRIFRLKTFAGLAAVGIGLAASIGLTALDPLGITRWTPDPDQVISVHVYESYGNLPTHSMPTTYVNVTYTNPAYIRSIIKIHQQVTKEDRNKLYDARIDFVYTLSNGQTIKRSYYYDHEGEAADMRKQFYSMPEYVLNYENWDDYLGSIASVSVNGTTLEGEESHELLAAIRKDCESGSYHYDLLRLNGNRMYTKITINYKRGYKRFVTVYYTCSESMNWIDQNIPSD